MIVIELLASQFHSDKENELGSTPTDSGYNHRICNLSQGS